ncbi:lipoyl amidotransferase LIPT1, mitochondrial [Oncorhynchus kisutch]|uniref:Lipoyl amidotransferase LIPT1, mitochondrial n=1 Tax=Oncorhynchus kisutch TaxID=8019 RepID=A0A8C7GQ84_ONCKI|nr:lipoyltransferase 1, mitochondrial [Oncorhynchus kisutch]
MMLRTFSNLCAQSQACFRSARAKSTLSAVIDETGKSGLILKSVSTDIFENLALEDWIHDHVDLQNRSMLFLWSNAPAVVIGRHQNPWQECNLQVMRQKGIPLARRRSGGGTVFHDLGNVNLTFFTSKKNYDRHRNLQVVTSALKGLRPDMDVRATERFDILLNGQHKISGTAAKLGRTAAYHHCTLLCSADRALLSAVLKPTCQGIKSNATQSVPSPVKNLLDEDPALDCDTIMDSVASQYNTEFGFSSPVTLVDPSDELSLPGIQRMARELLAWEWTFGRTPKFSICTTFELKNDTSICNATLNMDIKNGIIESCDIEVPSDWLPVELSREFSLHLIGGKLCPYETSVIAAELLRTIPQNKELERKMYNLCRRVVFMM